MSAPTPEDRRRAEKVWQNAANQVSTESSIAVIAAALARERGYTAKDMREAFVAGAKFTPLSGKPELWIDQVKAEALRRYGERKDGEAGDR